MQKPVKVGEQEPGRGQGAVEFAHVGTEESIPVRGTSGFGGGLPTALSVTRSSQWAGMSRDRIDLRDLLGRPTGRRDRRRKSRGDCFLAEGLGD